MQSKSALKGIVYGGIASCFSEIGSYCRIDLRFIYSDDACRHDEGSNTARQGRRAAYSGHSCEEYIQGRWIFGLLPRIEAGVAETGV